jgi:hypothetical protein
MSSESDQPAAAAGEQQSDFSPIPFLEAIRNEDKTWENLAPRYGVTNPDPPWKVSLPAEDCAPRRQAKNAIRNQE